MTSALYPEPAAPPRAVEGRGIPDKAARHLVSGTFGLGLGVFIERGAGFAANVLAARWGGASVFGAYSLALTTASNIATYAGAGIGSTAARFSGKYPYGRPGYGTLGRVLILVSLISAAAAGLGVLGMASPISRLIGQRYLSGLLRWASISAAAMILLECARGFFVGQRRLAALVLMSVLVGGNMLLFIPLAASHRDPTAMITLQGWVTVGAVVTCILLARPLQLVAPAAEHRAPPFLTMFGEVWRFGFVQLAGLIGINLAGWWLTTLVARADGSMVQMGYFSIASQMRNIVGLAPGLLTEGSFAVMADPDGELVRSPRAVLGAVTFAALLISFLLAACGIVLVPWILRTLYSSSYSRATVAVSFALALSVMHMGNAPASARLSILSLRSTATINTLWALFVASAGALLLSQGASAAVAMLVYLGAHTLSSALVLVMLARKDALPEGMAAAFTLTSGSAVALAVLAAMRQAHPGHAVQLNALMALLLSTCVAVLIGLGRHFRWIPARSSFQRLVAYGRSSMNQRWRGNVHAG
jgi:O-antigen/teichoic acid export membrane protein